MERRDAHVDELRWARVRAILAAVIAGAAAVWLAATWVERHSDAPDAIVVGEGRALLTDAFTGPVAVPGAEHLALVAVGSGENSQGGTGLWNGVFGRVSFGDEGLIAVDRRARHDGHLVVWCPETDRWEHPDGEHTYLRSGVRVSGPDRRWLGNVALEMEGRDLVVRPGVRLETGPASAEHDWRAVTPRCVTPAAD